MLFFVLYTDFKGIWVPRWSINDKHKIFTYLDGKFNHIFLQIFALGEAYYPSRYAPSKIKSDKWLKAFLEEAHRRNIKVSAWINVFYSWGYAPKSNAFDHPIYLQPQWYVQDIARRSILDYSIDELKRLGIEGYYLAPSNPQVRSYIINIAAEVISNYDFDGVHLDYIRYPGSEFIYDVCLRSNFMRNYYIDPLEIIPKSDLKMKLSLWGYDDIRTRWREFVYNDLTTFMKELNKHLKSKRPDITISVAVKPDYLNARNVFYQDWPLWLNANYIDFVCLMSYGKHIKWCLNKTLKVVKEPRRVTVGLGLYLLSPEEIRKQVKFVQSKPFSGVVFFSYDQVKENSAYLNALR